MQAWNYKVISIYGDPDTAIARWLWEEDGNRLREYPGSPSKPNLISKMTEFGEQGWELVSICNEPKPAIEYWFKRLIAAG